MSIILKEYKIYYSYTISRKNGDFVDGGYEELIVEAKSSSELQGADIRYRISRVVEEKCRKGDVVSHANYYKVTELIGNTEKQII